MNGMGAWCIAGLMVVLSSPVVAQRSAEFDIASVRVSGRTVGPDYNNRLTITPAGLTGRNVTLRRLVAEAYGLQLLQVVGPKWLDENEYDLEARAGHSVGKEERERMLHALLAQRFELKEHGETREMRVYELVCDQAGAKIRPVNEGEPVKEGGARFHGEMRGLADFLAVQLSVPALDNPAQPAMAGGPMIPVVDKTGLAGTYDFDVEMKPELGTDMFTMWQRLLTQRLGLRLESRRGEARVIVIDSAVKIPAAN